MSRDIDIFVKSDLSQSEFVDWVEKATGLDFQPKTDDQFFFAETGNVETGWVVLGLHEYPNDEETRVNFEDYEYYIRVVESGISDPIEREEQQDNLARKVYTSFEESGEYPFVATVEMEIVIHKYDGY